MPRAPVAPVRSAATDAKRQDPPQIYGCIANATAFQARMLPVTLLRDGNAPRNGVPYGKAMLPPRQMYALSHRSTKQDPQLTVSFERKLGQEHFQASRWLFERQLIQTVADQCAVLLDLFQA